MSFIPEFELGVWNAWMLVVLMFAIDIGLSSVVIRLGLGKARSQESSKRHSATPPYSRLEKHLSHLSTVTLLAAILYSVFLPLKLGTGWFYAGLVIYGVGVIFGFLATIHFALAPLNAPATEGVYRVSRNPMYFSMFVMFVGISVTCASWLFLFFTVVWTISSDRLVIAEERLCLATYGDAYREYMKRTPRWIGIPPSRKSKRHN